MGVCTCPARSLLALPALCAPQPLGSLYSSRLSAWTTAASPGLFEPDAAMWLCGAFPKTLSPSQRGCVSADTKGVGVLGACTSWGVGRERGRDWRDSRGSGAGQSVPSVQARGLACGEGAPCLSST